MTMMTTSSPQDLVNCITMACFCVLTAQAPFVVILLLCLLLRAIDQNMLSGHITQKLMVSLFTYVSLVFITYHILGMPCNANGNYLDLSMLPPPHHSTDDPDN